MIFEIFMLNEDKKVLVHYSEIALKGRNRSFFENKLVENIRKSSEHQKVNLKSVKKGHNLILCEFDSSETEEKINSALKSVFGIKYFSYVKEINKDINLIKEEVKKIIGDLKSKGFMEIAFKTKRADKEFPFNSLEINKELGEIANQFGLKVNYDLKNPIIYVEIVQNCCYIYSKKIYCYGGLPVGSSGKVLCLLSGGIDSPLAVWQMMKRGCQVDFLHVHNFRNNQEAIEHKIKEITKVLNKYQFKSKIYLVPYSVYEFHSIDKKIQDDLVLFRHYLFRIAGIIASENDYQAIVTGDNLGQVASQTLENMSASEFGISLPVFRPLLTYDKEEIINLAKEIGTYDLSIKEYKDCCSILAKNPKTKTNLKKFKLLLESLDIENLIEKSFKEIETFEIN